MIGRLFRLFVFLILCVFTFNVLRAGRCTCFSSLRLLLLFLCTHDAVSCTVEKFAKKLSNKRCFLAPCVVVSNKTKLSKEQLKLGCKKICCAHGEDRTHNLRIISTTL